jgi:hypothetical protein
VSDCAGTAALYTIERDLYATFFRFSPGQTLVLTVPGPTRLKFQFRPLHSLKSNRLVVHEIHENTRKEDGSEVEGYIDTWITVTVDGIHHHFPVTRNRAAPGLKLIGPGGAGAQPGIKVERELDLGPGLHRVVVSSEEVSILARLYCQRPAINLNLLPELNLYTYRFFLNSRVDTRKDKIDTGRKVFFIRSYGAVTEIPCRSPHSMGNLLIKNYKLQITNIGKQNSTVKKSTNKKLLRGVQVSAVRKAPYAMRLPPGRRRQKIDSFGEMAGLLKQAESDPGAADQGAAQAADYYYNQASRQHLYPLYSRMLTKTRWEPVSSVVNSAGLLPVKVRGWQPETPFMRVRRALLPPLADEDIVFTTTETLQVGLQYQRKKIVTARVSLETPGHLETRPLSLEFLLDGKRLRIIALESQPFQREISFAVRGGRHILILRPLVYQPNHFVRLRLMESLPGQASKPVPLARELTRYYHVATDEEPVHIKLQGPAWLRVDELRQGRTWSGYLFVPGNTPDIFLFPGGKVTFRKPDGATVIKRVIERGSPGSLLSNYRVFRQVFEVERQPRFSQPKVILQRPLPLREILFQQEEPGTPFILFDAFSPGRQEDPTWSFQIGGHDRRPFLEEIEDGETRDINDQYSQFTITRRYYNGKDTYSKTGGLLRLRVGKNPTVGIRHGFRSRPWKGLLVFDLSGAAFLQKPSVKDDAVNLHNLHHRWEWSFKLQGEVRVRQYWDRRILHLPGLRLFARYLSLNRESFPPYLVIDQDVYTPYKKDHRFGLTLEDFLLTRPWNTTQWWFNLGVTTNENLNPLKPDYVTARAGWKQLTGWGQLDVDYRWRRYFKDEDRRNRRDSHLLSVRLNWDIWLKNRQRIQLGGRLAREWLLKKNSFSFYLAWHFNNGRDYLDFSPSEIDFKDHKERRLFFKPGLKTNKIKEIKQPCP